MAAHARYGGSTTAQTLNCTGWRRFVDDNHLGDLSTDYADAGTLCHMAMERIKSHDDFDPRDVIGMEFAGHTLTKDVYQDKIVPALYELEQIFDEYNVEDFVLEARVKLFENAWGTGDILGRGSLEIIDNGEATTVPVGVSVDYKFGSGWMVDAYKNDQGVFYATAAAETPALADLFEDIGILAVGIIQPGNYQTGQDSDVWEANPSVMPEMKRNLRAAIDVAESGHGTFSKGKWCKFCPAKGHCPATDGTIQKMRRLDLSAPDIIAKLPTWDELQGAKAIIKHIEEFILAQVDQGSRVKDYKIIPTRASRVYTDEDAVKKLIRNSRKIKTADAYVTTLRTPTQMEKLCKELGLDYFEMFGALVKKVSSGTKLASLSDPQVGVPGLGELAALLDRD